MPKSTVPSFTNPTSVWGAAAILNVDGGQALRVSFNLPWYRTSDYANLSALVAAAGVGPYNILVDAHTHVTANLTIAAGIHLVPQPSFDLEVDNGVTFTINSPEHVHAGALQQVFTLTGTGAVAWTNGGRIQSRWFATLAGAVASAGAVSHTIQIVALETIAANLAVGANVTLQCQGAGGFQINNGITLTINSPAHVKKSIRRQLFTYVGTGVVAFTNGGIVYPAWWGTVNGTNVNAAITAIPSGIVHIPAGSYAYNDASIALKSGVRLCGEGIKTTELTYTGNNPIVECQGTGIGVNRIINTGVEEMQLVGKGAAQAGQYGIHFKWATHHIRLHNVMIYNCGDYSLYYERDTYLVDCESVMLQAPLAGAIRMSGITANGASNSNRFRDVHIAGVTTAYAVLLEDNTQDNKFVDVHFESCAPTTALISLQDGAKENEFRGVTFMDCALVAGQSPIQIGDSSSQNRVVHSAIGTDNAADYVVTISGTAIGNLIANNILNGASNKAAQNTGTGTNNKAHGNVMATTDVLYGAGIDHLLRFVPGGNATAVIPYAAFSTAAGTVVDINTVLGLPNDVVAVMLRVLARDSAGDGATTYCLFYKNGEANAVKKAANQMYTDGAAKYSVASMLVPLDVDGKFQYDVNASGANTWNMVVYLMGYWEIY